MSGYTLSFIAVFYAHHANDVCDCVMCNKSITYITSVHASN